MTKAQRTFVNVSFTVFVFLFAVSAMSPQTSAQNSNHGQIAGVVLDLNGRAVSNAKVTMANSQIGYSNSVNTSQDGSFGFINIPLARYELAASAPGFAVTRAALTVRGGAMPQARLLLQPAQQSGTTTLSGTVTLGESGKAVHGVTVTILQLRRTAVTDDNGKYQFQEVPIGKYDVVAHLDRVPDMVKSVDLTTGTATVDFQVELSGVREEVTVTATGTEQSVSSSIQSVEVIGSIDLAKKSPVSLGESLDGELGVAKRSFGPGTARPVIRGFDGDRVLILQDGNRIGGLGFESGDHAEPVSVLTVDRIEVVKGPATLLYGSSAIGGVVNAISRHDSAHKGISGYLTGVGATNRGQLSGSAGLEYGTDKWMIWGNAGGQTSDDYNTPLRRVANSFSRERSASAGAGYYPEKGFFSFNYNWDQRRYGIPYDPDEVDPEIVFLNPRRHSFEFKGGFRDSKSFLNAGTFSVQYNDYTHGEINLQTREVGTSFTNKSLVYQGIFDQQKIGRLSGRFGVWGSHRDFEASGEEALAPPTTHNAFAVFALETLEFEKASIQFGGRLETNRYKPTATPARGVLPDRTFTGFSGAIGLRVPTWKGGAFVANYSHSYRAPALEELYNEGPHPGNLAFEIGNPNLTREQGDAIDFGLRHSSKRFRVEANGFYYRISDFIFLAPTGATDPDSGLVIADYLQGKGRFFGSEAQASVALHPRIWLNVGADYVNAELTGTGTPLPRIPPLRGRVGLELRVKGLLVNPEFVMANHQDRVFPTETTTAGYGVFGISGSYMFAGQHHAQIISFNAFNLGDRLYRNHLSFIKEFAPEIGRGVRVTYTFRFF